MTLKVTFTPAEFETLRQEDLSNTACVVLDVLRATSTIVTALARGAAGVLPVGSIEEALRRRSDDPRVLLAGERGGERIRTALSGGLDFDLGNSPREYSSAVVGGRRIVTTTTNGTRAFAACRAARFVLAGSFLNLTRTAQQILRTNCTEVLLVCSGTGEQVAFEDCLGAGALCQQLLALRPDLQLGDAASLAADLFRAHQEDLEGAMQQSNNARRLLAMPDLAEDVSFCLTKDLYPIAVAADSQGWLHRLAA
jgi:2-phosphosulfolactate phosphatase